jgi:hypothetical protein
MIILFSLAELFLQAMGTIAIVKRDKSAWLWWGGALLVSVFYGIIKK